MYYCCNVLSVRSDCAREVGLRGIQQELGNGYSSSMIRPARWCDSTKYKMQRMIAVCTLAVGRLAAFVHLFRF